MVSDGNCLNNATNPTYPPGNLDAFRIHSPFAAASYRKIIQGTGKMIFFNSILHIKTERIIFPLIILLIV